MAHGETTVLEMTESLPVGQDFFMFVRPDGLHRKVKLENFTATETTVSTYADAVPLFAGALRKIINVLADADYNLDEEPESPTFGQGLPSFYEYKPDMPNGKKVWFLGLDPDYLTNV